MLVNCNVLVVDTNDALPDLFLFQIALDARPTVTDSEVRPSFINSLVCPDGAPRLVWVARAPCFESWCGGVYEALSGQSVLFLICFQI